ncbi:MAG: hypothetical protein ACREP9_10630, partial [Candidatus Dormibacteraceae bacterium]
MPGLFLALGLVIPMTAQQAAPITPAPSTPVNPPVAATTIAATASVSPAPENFPVLDDGLLETKWFGTAITFQKADSIDFYWIKPGLNLSGSTLAFQAWDDPVALKPGRDKKDQERAQKLSDSLPGLLMRGFEPAFGQKVKESKREGDYTLVGRVVDANAKSTGARFFAPAGIGAAETVTWDFKIMDTKSHELVAAFHHRVVSATVMST